MARKLFGTDGIRRAPPAELGRAKRLDEAGGRYIEFVKQSFPKGLRLDGLRIVVDCAHGAAHRVAPTVFWELGAEVFSIGVSPDGLNINRDCGALAPEQMRREVLERRADIGIALDGDADRLIVADERGVILDGDQLMALIATNLARGGRLAGGALVATVMSNLGLERCLDGQGIGLHRTAVGDRYVVEKMRSLGCNLGGEQSGHIILSDYATTGDGLIAALQVLAAIVETGKRASEVCRVFESVALLVAVAGRAVTGLTAQSAAVVCGVWPIAPEFIRRQSEVVLDDIGADAVKSGMLHEAAVIETVAAVLAERASDVPLIVDPV